MSEIVFLNGSLVPRSQAMISALDNGFLYGYGLFETMRAYDGRVFCIEKHLHRLKCSAGILGIPTGNLKLEDAVMEVMLANRLSDARIRITVSIGEGEVFAPDMCRKPTVLIVAVAYKPHPEAVYNKGFCAVISTIHRNSRSPLSRFKTANYLDSILSKKRAIAAGADEAVCLNEKGFIAEGSMSNVFVVTDGVLRTPGEEGGILPGIARETAIELASDLGMETEERDISPDELINAQEAFLTNSMIEVMPLTGVNGKAIGSGRPGVITRKLMAAYRRMARRDA